MSAHHRTSSWQKTVRDNRPRIARTLPSLCIDCGSPVLPTQRWQVGHRISAAQGKALGWTTAQINDPSNLGPTHTKGPGQRACNQIAGGKLGAAKSSASSSAGREKRRMPSW